MSKFGQIMKIALPAAAAVGAMLFTNSCSKKPEPAPEPPKKEAGTGIVQNNENTDQVLARYGITNPSEIDE
ncbi:MAG: hypothetical protein LBJ74_06105, partial [Heliobacteriaceae bacterium]|nr:hypothetical protein [Heliobacteriaceae bacterium]